MAIGSRQTSSEISAQTAIHGLSLPIHAATPNAAINGTLHARCVRNVRIVSTLLASPFGVTTNVLRRRSSAANNDDT